MCKGIAGRIAVLALCFLVPLLQGGCPEFRNGLVDAADTATRDLIFGRQDPQAAVETAATSVINAALDLFFDQFRTGSSVASTALR